MKVDNYIKLCEKRYAKYWDNEEINVDLANSLVDAVPKLIKIINDLKQEISLLCPIGDLDTIESLKTEKIAYMEENNELLKTLTNAYVGWACGLDVVTGMKDATILLIDHGVNLEKAKEEHVNKINEKRRLNGLLEFN